MLSSVLKKSANTKLVSKTAMIFQMKDTFNGSNCVTLQLHRNSPPNMIYVDGCECSVDLPLNCFYVLG